MVGSAKIKFDESWIPNLPATLYSEIKELGTWPALGEGEYLFTRTLDGSPSIRYAAQKGQPENSELMHSSKGAFSESLSIYGSALNAALSLHIPLKIRCVGLGLGYLEMMSVSILLSRKISLENVLIESHELHDDLRHFFESWITGKSTPPLFHVAYEEILTFHASHFNLSKEELRRSLFKMHSNAQLVLTSALHPSTAFPSKANIIFFDAYSPLTSAELWEGDLLSHLLQEGAESPCVFSTYASRTELKRTLLNNGFALSKRAGFAGKREATLAVRF